MPEPLLRIESVAKSFGSVRALAGVSLTVEAGQVVCIIGPSGCGKSTLLRCINFLEEPDEGSVRLDGELVGIRMVRGRQRRDREANINRIRGRIGMVFQQFNVWPHFTVLENVVRSQICVAGRPRAEAERRARELLARVGLAEKAASAPAELSGGQLQRVAIARALAMDPRLMLFDEPTSALDPERVGEVLQVIRELADHRRAMIIVTHELRFTAQIADRVLFMDAGRIVEDGPPSEILVRPKSERLKQFMAKVLYNSKEAL